MKMKQSILSIFINNLINKTLIYTSLLLYIITLKKLMNNDYVVNKKIANLITYIKMPIDNIIANLITYIKMSIDNIIVSNYSFILNSSVFFILLIFLLLTIALTTLLERKVMGSIQRRRGPNITGLFGFLQPIADGLKLFVKEIIILSNANVLIFLISPLFTFFCSILLWIVIPFDKAIVLLDFSFSMLFLLAISSLSVYGLIFSGWSSNSKYAFLGGLRSSAQMISYEVCIAFIWLSVCLVGQSLNIIDIVKKQEQSTWFIFMLFPLWILFFIIALAETNRAPFDLPEAEAELVAGYNVEYSSIIFALFFLGEYSNMALMSSLSTLFFLGGWLVPFNIPINAAFCFGLKVTLNLFIFIWVRATLPRYRYDQLMVLGWKKIMPLSFLIFLFNALMMLIIKKKLIIICYYINVLLINYIIIIYWVVLFLICNSYIKYIYDFFSNYIKENKIKTLSFNESRLKHGNRFNNVNINWYNGGNRYTRRNMNIKKNNITTRNYTTSIYAKKKHIKLFSNKINSIVKKNLYKKINNSLVNCLLISGYKKKNKLFKLYRNIITKKDKKKKMMLKLNKNMKLFKNIISKVTPTSHIIKKERVLENTISNISLFNKFIGHIVKKGKKRRALTIVKKVFNVLNIQFNIQFPVSLLFLAVYNNKSTFELQKVRIRSKEIIYPKIVPMKKRYTLSLLRIMNHAWKNVNLYNNVHTSIAYSIMKYALGYYRRSIKKINATAFKNKYNFLTKIKKNRNYKVRLNKKLIRKCY